MCQHWAVLVPSRTPQSQARVTRAAVGRALPGLLGRWGVSAPHLARAGGRWRGGTGRPAWKGRTTPAREQARSLHISESAGLSTRDHPPPGTKLSF